MTERLLQYIWQFQQYNAVQLTTFDGEPLRIIHPGIHNTNQGPDFLNAKVQVNNTLWAGSIELHIQSSQWTAHGHSSDANFNNVILHVVWENDVQLKDNFPVLELKGRVSGIILDRYSMLLHNSEFIPCQKMIHQVNNLTWMAWKERLLVERLEQKTGMVLSYLQKNNMHWEEAFWWLLAKNFGMKVNGDAFEKIAQSIPLNILAKHKNQIHQLEALLLGQAGLLNEKFDEAYPIMLQKEYRFLQTKYQLKQPGIALLFLRMRPANFPSVRLAQLAMLVHQSVHLFSTIRESKTIAALKQLLDVTANDYWHEHYVPGEKAAFKKKNLGAQTVNNILINTVIPLIFSYGIYHNDYRYKDKAINWLTQLAAEKNNITTAFEKLGVANQSAFDSQALLQLRNIYCNNKRCLDCTVGNILMKPQGF
ncbi:MAG: DUF2851 family protein [Bacteroidetes bacterium]|nr:DUF2851 family protein [Bacteroidota bacterium]